MKAVIIFAVAWTALCVMVFLGARQGGGGGRAQFCDELPPAKGVEIVWCVPR